MFHSLISGHFRCSDFDMYICVDLVEIFRLYNENYIDTKLHASND